MVGKILSHYEILQEIGRGGMGIVYKALDRKLNREVALKILPDALMSDPARRRRFVREARAAAALSHSNIAVIYEIDEVEGTTFIAMELIEGKSLSELLARGPLSVPDAIAIAEQIADAFGQAHDRGIVHRDLKPANIMVSDDGRAKLIDYGLAKLIEPAAGASSRWPTAVKDETREGQLLGTLSYLSPEQARGQKVDHRTDIFSFGIVLYELLTGKPPFRTESPAELPHAIIHEPAAPLDDAVNGDREELQRILDKCLAKDREHRYQTAKDLAIDLRRVRTGARAPAAVAPASQRRLFLGAAAAVAMAGLVSFALLRSDSDAPLPRIARTIQLTHDPGLEVDPSISPDGSMVVYVKGPVGATKIYVQQIAGGRAVALTEDLPGAHFRPRWSPDGTQISFSSDVDGRITIHVVPSLGGAARRLVDNGAELAWSPDNRHIAYAESGAGPLSSTSDVMVRSVEGASRAEHIVRQHDTQALSWSRDGERIAYAVGNYSYLIHAGGLANLAPSSLWTVAPLEPQAMPSRLTDDEYLDQSPVWSSDDRHIFFVSDRGGGRDIYRVALGAAGAPAAAPERLTTGLDPHTISLSVDGTKLAYSVLTTRQNIWSLPVPDVDSRSVSEATPVTQGSQIVEGMHVSPDLRWILFDSNRGGGSDIYKMPLGGGDLVRLTTHPAGDFVPAWSLDQNYFAFHSFRTENRDIFTMSSEGGAAHRITNDPGFDNYPDWSPDGRSIVFQSNRSGAMEVYVVSVADGKRAGEPIRLTHEGGWAPEWSPDGTRIAFSTGSAVAMMSADGEDVRILAPDTGVTLPAWSDDGDTVYYRTGDRRDIYSVPAAGGAPALRVRFDDPRRVPLRGEWTVRGGRFYFTLAEHESDIWLMELEPGDAR